jgi:cellulose synthase/poly-beta-1,6-N-acetylglucosamine synthase-like glycosyltransferase
MISIITCTIRDNCLENVFNNFMRQSWKEKEMIIILNNDDMDSKKWFKEASKHDNVFVYRVEQEATLGDCLNFGIEKAKYNYLAKFDDDDYYGPSYLSQAIQALQSSDEIGIVGKNSYYIYFKEDIQLFEPLFDGNEFVDHVAGATLVFKREAWKRAKFRKRNRAEDYFFIHDVLNAGYKVYSTNKKNFAMVRINEKYHTWQQSNEELKQNGKLITFKEHISEVVNDRN